MKKIIFSAFIFAVLAGCNDDNIIEVQKLFEVKVISQDGQPVAGAAIEGGIDWDAYQVYTNSAGVAILGEKALKRGAVIYKTNYLPIRVSAISPNTYTLKKTAKQLNLIGNVMGKAVRFRQNELITIDYQGNYHLYSYNDQSVTEVFTQHLHDSVNAVPEHQLIGDKLWLATHNNGIFVYSIQNPSSPQLLFSLPVTGYLGPFAVKDSFLVVGDRWNPGPVRFFVFQPNGDFREVSRVQNYYVRKMAFIGNYVILIGNSESLPTVFDVTNVFSPRVVFNGLDWEHQTGFFYDQNLILIPYNAYGGDNAILDYKVLDLSNPETPTPLNIFTADSWLTGLASDNLAYGNYYFHSQTISVLEGNISNYYFETIATVSEGTIDGVGGAFPPYFVIGNRLWKLVDRN